MNYTDESQQVNGWLKNENTHVNTDNSKVNANLLTENKTLKDKIAELEVKLSRAETTGGKAQAKRDLEMKEKGVYEFTSSTGFWDLSTCKLRTYSRDFQKHLRKQASDL